MFVIITAAFDYNIVLTFFSFIKPLYYLLGRAIVIE